jgi:valyl-tRNA synthetase
VKGLVDYDIEIKQLQKNLNATIPSTQSLETKISADGYEQNAPDDLVASNKEKLEALLKKKSEPEETTDIFERLHSYAENQFYLVPRRVLKRVERGQ